MIRKLAGITFLAACAATGWILGSGLASEAAADAPNQVGWAVHHNVVAAQPTDCQAATQTFLADKLGASESVIWQWSGNLPYEHAAWGQAYREDGRVVLDTSIPCDFLPSVVIHEWAHMVTPHDMPGGEELGADCVVTLLQPKLAGGSRLYTPYMDRAGITSCSPESLSAATEVVTRLAV